MSTERHLELARAMFAAVTGEGDPDLLDELLADNYVLHDPSEPEHCTREGFMEQVRAIRERYSEPRFIIHDIFGSGDRVTVRWTLAGDYAAPADAGMVRRRRIAHDGISILRIVGDQIAEEWAVYDELGLQRQLGALAAG